MTSVALQQSLQQASSTGDQVTLVKLLREADTNISGKDKAGWTALMRASVNGHHNIVTVLLQADFPPEINSQNKFGKTALHYACANGYTAIVKALLFYGADPSIQDKAGKTPLDDCVENKQVHLLTEVEQSFPAIVLPGRLDAPYLEYALPNMLCSAWCKSQKEVDQDLTREERNELEVTEYRLQLAPHGTHPLRWRTIATGIKTLTFRVRGVEPATAYVLRASAKNKFGWGPWSPSSEIMKTKETIPTPSNGDLNSSVDSECSSDEDQRRSAGYSSHGSQEQEESSDSLPHLSAKDGIMFTNGDMSRSARSIYAPNIQQNSGSGTPPKIFLNTGKAVRTANQNGSQSGRSSSSGRSPQQPFSADRRTTSLPSIQKQNGSNESERPSSEQDTTAVVLRTLQSRNTELKKQVQRLTGDEIFLEEMELEELRSLESTLEHALSKARKIRDIKIQQSMGDELERKLCVACYTHERTVLMLPCKHLCMCDGCSSLLMSTAAEDARRSRQEDLKPRCPVCRADVNQLMSIFN